MCRLRAWKAKRWLGVVMNLTGTVLLIIFIPVQFWTVVLGILLILGGILCL